MSATSIGAGPSATHLSHMRSMRVALNIPFSTEEVAEYLFQRDVLPYWLGEDAELLPRLDARPMLPIVRKDPAGNFQCRVSMADSVKSVEWPSNRASVANRYEVIVALDAQTNRSLTLRLSPRPGGTCRFRIEQRGLDDDAEVRANLRIWQGALNRVGRLMAAATKKMRRERQAVIVVHGIGDQAPGQLLRQFVANVFDRAAGEVHFVKPDYVASLFEMRMATVPRIDGTRPTTDVYELYWAHLMRDTTVAQVYGWVLRLLFSGDDKIPQTLIRLVRVLRATLLVGLLLLVWLSTKDVPAWLTGLGLGALLGLPGILSSLFKVFRDKFIVGYAGDAARYLEPRPANIAVRQQIQEAGATLLDALHDKGRYSRIIVYGHSLGSVIAYDILSHAWTQRSRRRAAGAPSSTCSRALRAVEDLVNPRTPGAPAPDADQAQQRQHAAWVEYRRNGFEWLVTDLVTAGSPLAHARWLLNLDATTQFADRVRERSIPTCPPQTETAPSPVPDLPRQVFTFTHAFPEGRSPRRKRSVLVPHHAGLFAVTRWTNLYYPHSGILKGDPVAGPLGGLFGAWVRDKRLEEANGFAHTWYTDRGADPAGALEVRAALNLPFRSRLGHFAPHELAATRLS